MLSGTRSITIWIKVKTFQIINANGIQAFFGIICWRCHILSSSGIYNSIAVINETTIFHGIVCGREIITTMKIED